MSSAAGPAASPAASPMAGVVLILGGMLLLTLNDALMKQLVTALPLGEVVGLRGLAGAAATVMAAPLLGGRRALVPKSWKNVAVLSGLLVIGLFGFPWTLRHMPLADAVMIVSLSPVFVAALSPWLLGEQVGWRRWAAVVVGIVGVGLVIGPGGSVAGWVVVVPLGIAAMVGFRDLLLRRSMRVEHSVAIVLWANVAAGICGLATIPQGWVMPTGPQVGMLLACAALLTVSQVMVTSAFRHADATVLSCLKYSAIVWAALLGWLLWGDRLSAMDWLGAALITLSGVVITLRTRR